MLYIWDISMSAEFHAYFKIRDMQIAEEEAQPRGNGAASTPRKTSLEKERRQQTLNGLQLVSAHDSPHGLLTGFLRASKSNNVCTPVLKASACLRHICKSPDRPPKDQIAKLPYCHILSMSWVTLGLSTELLQVRLFCSTLS